jgi:hypothetical protein
MFALEELTANNGKVRGVFVVKIQTTNYQEA